MKWPWRKPRQHNKDFARSTILYESADIVTKTSINIFLDDKGRVIQVDWESPIIIKNRYGPVDES